MKSVAGSALLLLAFSLSAQAPQPVPLARGNTPGEPHHHLKIENEYVRAYYVEVPAHEDTQLHQHDNDYLFLTLGGTEVINAVLGKPEVKLSLKDGEVRFTRGGFAHVARNPGDKPFRNVTIEFLHPQEGPRNICDVVVPNSPPTAICHYPRPDAPVAHSSGLFETNEVLGELYSLGPNVRAPRLKSKMDRLLVVYDQSQIRTELPGQAPIDLRGGDSLWLPFGHKPVIKNLMGAAPSRFLMLSFKGSGAAKKP